MQCIFVFRDAQGRLPTAGELRARGFVVSAAVQPPEPAQDLPERPRALAAEPPASYGGPPDACGGGEDTPTGRA